MNSVIVDYHPPDKRTRDVFPLTRRILNWQTYTNTKHGYQINYLADWTMEVDGAAVWQN